MPKGQSKKNNSEKRATQGIQVDEKQSKDTSQYVLDTTMRKQPQMTQIRYEPSYKQQR